MSGQDRATMTLDIDEEALDFIRRKGKACTIKQIHVETTFEPLPHLSIDFEAPDSARGFHVDEAGGVTFYVGRGLFFKRGVVRVRLGRFLWFRWLELPTHTLFDSLGEN